MFYKKHFKIALSSAKSKKEKLLVIFTLQPWNLQLKY